MKKENNKKEKFSVGGVTNSVTGFVPGGNVLGMVLSGDSIGNIIKKLLLGLLLSIFIVFIIGSIFFTMMKVSNLLYTQNIKNYVKYFLFNSIVVYILAFIYIIYSCYQNKTKFSNMDFKNYALASLFGVGVVLFHIGFLIGVSFIKFTPLLGSILNIIAWSTIGIMISTGILFLTVGKITYALIKCSKK